MSRCGPDDPRIQLIKDAVAKNPRFTRHQCHQCFGVARPTLDRWVAEGLIPALYVQSRVEQTAHWRKFK